MSDLSRQDYVRLVEEDYFGNVVAGNLDKVLNCFTEDVAVTIRHGDNLPRRFNRHGIDGASKLEDFYRHLCENFTPWFGEFEHYIDIPEQRCSCTFVVKLTPLQDSDYLGAGPQNLRNCNFFKYRDGKIAEPIKGATIIGNGPSTMHKIDMVGKDFSLDSGIGICGKDGQSIPVGVGQPSLKINEITVGGTDTNSHG